MSVSQGREFLSIPGPTNVPDEVLAAMHRPAIDIYSGEMIGITDSCLADLAGIFRTKGRTYIYAANGHGGWEAALTNVLSRGELVLALESGRFATGWGEMASMLGVEVEVLKGDWRRAVDPAALEERLRKDKAHLIKAILVVQIDTASGVVNDIPAMRKALDAAKHPALLMVDTISSLASIDYRHDEWGVDVTVGGSQKGLMLPPGLSFNAISDKALTAAREAKMPRSYWAWDEMLAAGKLGFFPYTPATNLLYGLRESLRMLDEEGLDNVFARHARHSEATRRAVRAWGLEVFCLNPDEYSHSLTAVLCPPQHDADKIRQVILERFDMSLGTGLGKVQGKVFRIGHLGDFNDLMLAGTLCGVEMGLQLAGVPLRGSGVGAALEYLGTAAMAPHLPVA